MNRFKLAVIFVFMAFSAKAQMSYFGADMNLLRSKSELLYFGDFDIKADVQFSVIDNWLFPDRDSKFRFGDLMGIKGGFGFGRIRYYGDSDRNRMPLSFNIGFHAGGFLGYQDDKLGFYLKQQREWFSAYFTTRYCSYGTKMDVTSVACFYKKMYYAEIGIGKPVIVRENDAQNSMSRFVFKVFPEFKKDKMNEFIGFKVELVNDRGLQTFNNYSFVAGYTL